MVLQQLADRLAVVDGFACRSDHLLALLERRFTDDAVALPLPWSRPSVKESGTNASTLALGVRLASLSLRMVPLSMANK